MLQITPQMRILLAVEAVDFRKGIGSLAELCRAKLYVDPFSGCVRVSQPAVNLDKGVGVRGEGVLAGGRQSGHRRGPGVRQRVSRSSSTYVPKHFLAHFG
ncbi:MAG TPA: hypothetical protein VKV15_12855 [Bryobacteraceae bacterium]|nr:hypothetical protein [Bryobacteraceae bacterium]